MAEREPHPAILELARAIARQMARDDYARMNGVRNQTASALRIEWFGRLGELADIKLQQKNWLDPKNQNPHWSFVEFVCSFPDDGQLQQATKDGWLMEGEAEILERVRRALGAYSPPNDDSYADEQILNDPAWQAVVAIAEKATAELAPLLTDQNELAAVETHSRSQS